MARYILIDNNSGYIFGDSADLNGRAFSGSPEEFAAALDAAIGRYDAHYELISYNPRNTETGYQVFRADADMPVADDGRDQDAIEAVGRECQYWGFIRVTPCQED